MDESIGNSTPEIEVFTEYEEPSLDVKESDVSQEVKELSKDGEINEKVEELDKEVQELYKKTEDKKEVEEFSNEVEELDKEVEAVNKVAEQVNEPASSLEQNMELLELDDDNTEKAFVMKLKSPKIASSPPPTTNRRYNLRPQKRPENTDCDKYVATPGKRRSLTNIRNGLLETIFENPVYKNGFTMFLGKKKMKRSITFSEFVDKTKLRHRKLKVKRLRTKVKKPKKISLEELKLRLQSLEETGNDDEYMDVND